MLNSANDSQYDLIVIGSGQAGNPLASAFHAQSKRVAMIERAAVGGTCVNYGCTPTKTMVASAEVAHMASRAAEYGIHTGEVTVDISAVIQRKHGVVAKWREGSEKKFEDGIDLLRGTGSFAGAKQIQVALNDGSQTLLSGGIIVIDTGLSPLIPKIDGIQSLPFLDNVSILEVDHVPEHLLVLGGGYIGLEFAQMFRRFGSRVTVLQSGSQLLTNEDSDVAEEVARLLREDGIDILLNARATAVRSSVAGVRLTFSQGIGGPQTIEGSDLLVATGRKPNTAELSLDAAGIACNQHGYISVNERLETSAPGVYAVGDVNGGPAFTHISYDDYRVLKANLLDGGSRVTTGRPVPYCVFLDPQLGRIGLSEKAAKAAGRDYKVAKMQASSIARAYEMSRTRGFLKALFDPATGEILGAACLCAEGGEIMAMLEIAMMAKLPYTALRDGIFAHPTFAECLNTLFTSVA